MIRSLSIVTIFILMIACPLTRAHVAFAQSTKTVATPEKVILDTDIGDDIDDAFALTLALTSPQVQLLGITTAWGNTDLRARLVERFLQETGQSNIPVAAGPQTRANSVFTQRRWAEELPARQWPKAIPFMIREINRYPGQITLISIAPFSNVGALIEQDPAVFRKLKRVVIMGGSIYRGYGDLGYLPNRGPSAEYNIAMDIPASRKLFSSGVPIYMMPLDSTQLKLDEVLRKMLFSQNTPYTNALTELYEEWTASTLNSTPTLYDAMAVAESIQPSLCPTIPMHIAIDDNGYTRVVAGRPNVYVCLHSDSDRFFHFYIPTILQEKHLTEKVAEFGQSGEF